MNRALGLDKEATQVDWILKQAKLPIFFYDPLQIVGPSGISPDKLHALLGNAMDSPIELSTQMRVRGGTPYLSYVSDILAGKNPKPLQFNDYEFVLHDDFESFVDSF